MSRAHTALVRPTCEAPALRAQAASCGRAAGRVPGPRLLAALLLGVLAWTIASPTLASTRPAPDAARATPGHHTDGAPCPDGDDEGPCDDGCPCFCCPGHASAMFAPTAASLDAPDLIALLRSLPDASDRPTGIRPRLFRPPRV